MMLQRWRIHDRRWHIHNGRCGSCLSWWYRRVALLAMGVRINVFSGFSFLHSELAVVMAAIWEFVSVWHKCDLVVSCFDDKFFVALVPDLFTFAGENCRCRLQVQVCGGVGLMVQVCSWDLSRAMVLCKHQYG